MKQAIFAYVNHARIRSWNQPVLSNEGKVSCSSKQRGPLLGLELTTERHPPTTSQTRYPLRHAAPPLISTIDDWLKHLYTTLLFCASFLEIDFIVLFLKPVNNV